MLEDSTPIEARHLPVLLNVLQREGYDRFDVLYPVNRLRLLTVDLSGLEVLSLADEDDFHLGRADELLRREMPRHSDLKECLITSGCLPLENREEVDGTLLEMYRLTHDGREVLKERYLAIDTNVAYLRFPSRHFPLPHSPKRYIHARDFKWVVSEIVWREVDSSIREKYSPREIERLERGRRRGSYFSALINASTKRSRKAKAAMWELNYIRSRLNGFRVGGGPFERDKEVRDISIARDYSRFSRERDVEVLLITADRDMEYHASAEGLPTLLLKMPHHIPGRLPSTFRAIASLICDLAETLAFIRLKEPEILIMGEWAGKDLREQEREELLLVPESGDGRRVVERCKKEIRISEKVEEMLRTPGPPRS